MSVQLQEPTVRPEALVRRRRITPGRLVLGAFLTAVSAFVAAYAAFFTPDSPPPLALSGPAEAVATVPPGVWTAGTGSVVGYRVREKLLRLPASNDAVGRTGAVTGSFRLEPAGDGLLVRAGMRMEADLTTLTSDEARRDDHMRTMGIETDRFPTAGFVSTADLLVRPEPGSAAARALIRGELILHGVTRAVEVPVQARYDGSRIEVVGSLSFAWDLFGMQQPNLSYVTVEADPTMEFQLFFDRTAP